MAHKKMRKRTHENGSDGFGLLRHALTGTAISAIAGAALLLISAGIAYSCDDPHSVTTPLALLSLYLSALIGGFSASRMHRSDALLCGTVSGGVLMLLYLLLSCFLSEGFETPLPLYLLLILRLMIVVCAILGGFLGLPRPKKRRRRA